MPVQPVISMDQIVIIVAFYTAVLLMWFVKRNRGGIAGRLNPSRRMQHVEDLARRRSRNCIWSRLMGKILVRQQRRGEFHCCR